jgi:uncharacterized heparinase superfamily protein
VLRLIIMYWHAVANKRRIGRQKKVQEKKKGKDEEEQEEEREEENNKRHKHAHYFYCHPHRETTLKEARRETTRQASYF